MWVNTEQGCTCIMKMNNLLTSITEYVFVILIVCICLCDDALDSVLVHCPFSGGRLHKQGLAQEILPCRWTKTGAVPDSTILRWKQLRRRRCVWVVRDYWSMQLVLFHKVKHGMFCTEWLRYRQIFHSICTCMKIYMVKFLNIIIFRRSFHHFYIVCTFMLAFMYTEVVYTIWNKYVYIIVTARMCWS